MNMHTDKQPAAGPELSGGEYLTFTVAQEHYGVDILQVREIRSFEKATRIAGAASHFLGVLNLRGTIVPIMDLRLLLNPDDTSSQTDGRTAIVIVCVDARVLGLVVDSVSDVTRVEAGQMRELPRMPMVASGSEVVAGLADIEGQCVLLLDLARVADRSAHLSGQTDSSGTDGGVDAAAGLVAA